MAAASSPRLGARWALGLAIGLAFELASGRAKAGDDDLPPEEGAPQTGPQAPPVPPLNYFSLLPPDLVEAELERRHQLGGALPVILERVTRGLVAAPYLLSPLGEGQGQDPDPRFRLDAFDCTTFVETAIALTLCDELPAAAALLDQIRYHGAPGFGARRHLMTSQWIPGLIAEGYLEDVTRAVGGDRTQTVQLLLDEQRWNRRRVAKSLTLEALPLGTWSLDYLPVAELERWADRIPAGTIINVVRANAPSSPDLITHQALVLARPDGTLFVRHASPVSKRVVDETIAKIITRYQKPRAWPILGLNLLRLVEAQPAEASARAGQQ